MQMSNVVRWAAAILVASATLAAPAAADENSLIDQFNKAVGLINGGKYAEGREALAELTSEAEKVRQGDAAYDRAQELLARVPQLEQLSYSNSSIEAERQAHEAIEGGKPAEAVEHWEQSIADLEQLQRLTPDDAGPGERLDEARKSLARLRPLVDLLGGKDPDAQALAAVPLAEPELLSEGAPGFSLPLCDKASLVWPLDEAESLLVVDLWLQNDPTLPLAADVLSAVDKRYRDRGVKVMAVLLEGQAAKIAEFARDRNLAFPVALDDLAEFRQHYLSGGVRLPAHLVITKDRRALWITGADRLESSVSLCATLARELERGEADTKLPQGPAAYFPQAAAFSAAPLEAGVPQGLRFGERPAILLITNANERGKYVEELAAVAGEFGPRGLDVVAAVHGRDVREVRQFATENKAPFPVYLLKSTVPDCYGPNSLRLVLVSSGGRVLKVMPIYSGASYQQLLNRFASILVEKSYPGAADEQHRANLAHRASGGRVERISGGDSTGAASGLIDGIMGREGWKLPARLPAEIEIAFLLGQPAAFDQVVLENAPQGRGAPIRDVELLAASGPRGQFRSLGTFRLAAHSGPQAFRLPKTSAARVKLRLLSTYAAESGSEASLGEVAVVESAGAEPDLARRLADHFAQAGMNDSFSDPGLAFWEQVEYFPAVADSSWQVRDGRLVQSRSPHEWSYRSSALLHAYAGWQDYRLSATVEGRGAAAGLLLGFRDWDNFDRLLLLEGQNLQTSQPEGNSIRLERSRDGRVEVLALHGEAFPLDKPVELEVIRRGEHLAVKANGRFILHVEDETPSAGRVGLFASGSSEYLFDNVRIVPLGPNESVELPEINPLSTAAGASIVWVSSQGEGPEGWASNLLRTPVFSPPGVWQAKALPDQPPEIVFAFRGGRPVMLEQITLARPGSRSKAAARRVEVLVSRDSGWRGFQSVGLLDLEPSTAARDKMQAFPLANVPCRYLMLRLVANGGGDVYELAGVGVRAVDEADEAAAGGAEQELARIEEALSEPAETDEKEPNDKLDQAIAMADGQPVAATIGSGEVDLFRIPEPPAEGGLLRLEIEALPWLRLRAEGLDERGKPLGAALANLTAAQRAEQVRPAASAPRYVRVEMPAASLAAVIDTSGSMTGREEDLNAAVKSFLEGVTASESVEVLRFSNDVQQLAPFSNDSRLLVDAVDGKLRMDGATALYQALLRAIGDLSAGANGGRQRGHSQAIVLLSDGMNTIPGPGFADVCLALKRQPLPVFVIGIGVDLHQYDAGSGNTAYGLLENLARQSGGRFLFAPESEVLEELYGQIAGELRGDTRYRLRAAWEALPRVDRSAELAGGASRPPAGRLASLPLPPAAGELAPPARLAGPVRPSVVLPAGASDLASVKLGPSISVLPARVPAPSEPAPVLVPRGAIAPQGLPPAASELALAAPAAGLAPLHFGDVPQFGTLRVEYRGPDGQRTLPPPLMPAVELILDSSFSMAEKMGTRPKIEIAREVMQKLVDTVPDGVHLGLRFYGYYGVWILRRTDPTAGPVRNDDPRLNTDSDLVEPIGPVTAQKRERLRAWLAKAQPRGNTPLVFSLLEARKDIASLPQASKTVILISDGKETCGGKLEDVTAAYRGGDVAVVIHVVGFDIQETEAQQQLEELARIGGGNYYQARDAGQLGGALAEAIETTGYSVYRGGESTVWAQGIVNGAELELEAGPYRVVPPGTGGQSLEIEIAPGAAHSLVLDENGQLAE